MSKGVTIKSKRVGDDVHHHLSLAPRHTLPDLRTDKSKPGVVRLQRARVDVAADSSKQFVEPFFAVIDAPAVSR